MADFSTPLPQAGGAAAVDGAAPLLSKLMSKEWWMGHLSVLSVQATSFFNPLEFSVPGTQTEAIARIYGNSAHFKLVYAALFAPVMFFTLASSRWLRIGSFLLLALNGYAFGYHKQESLGSILGVPLPKVVTVPAVSVLIMIIFGMLNAIFYAAFLFALVGLPHMSLHNHPSGAAADALDAVELQGLSTGGSA